MKRSFLQTNAKDKYCLYSSLLCRVGEEFYKSLQPPSRKREPGTFFAINSCKYLLIVFMHTVIVLCVESVCDNATFHLRGDSSGRG